MLTGVKRLTAYKAMCVFAALGIIVAGYSLYTHFSLSSSFCNFGEKLNCDMVNRGTYSEMFGIPIAFFGIIAYIFQLVLAKEQITHPRRSIKLLLAASLGVALAFSAHLAWISSELLETWCVACIASYVITAALAGIFFVTEV